MKRKIALSICLLMLAAVWLTACGRKDEISGTEENIGMEQNNTTNSENNNGMSDNAQDQETNNNGGNTDDVNNDASQGSSDSFNEFQGMVQSGTDKEQLYTYLEQNGAGASYEEADQMVASMFSYYDDPTMIDAERLMNMDGLQISDGMRSFLTAMKREGTDPTITDEGIKVSQEELLNRSLEMENIYSDNIDSPVGTLAYDRYNTLIHAAVTGGYDAGNNMPNSYADESGQKLSSEAMTGYQNFIDANPDSKTAGILNRYLSVAGEADHTIGDTVVDFYDTIKDTVRDIFDGI